MLLYSYDSSYMCITIICIQHEIHYSCFMVVIYIVLYICTIIYSYTLIYMLILLFICAYTCSGQCFFMGPNEPHAYLSGMYMFIYLLVSCIFICCG